MFATNTNFLKTNVLVEKKDGETNRKKYQRTFMFCVFIEGGDKPYMYLAHLS